MKNKIRSIAVCLVLFLFIASTAFAAEYWKEKRTRFGATAGEALTVGDVLYIKASDGEVYKADADAEESSIACGVAGTIAADGSYVEVVVDGILAGQTSATSGHRLYVSDTAGAFSVGDLTGMNLTYSEPVGFVLPAISGGATSSLYFIRIASKPSPGAKYTRG